MLDGAIFGRDIIAANPPLAWYLALPAAAISKYFHFDPVDALRLQIVLLTVGVLACAYHLRRPTSANAIQLVDAVIVLVLAYYLFAGVFRDFGQREHICLALTMPYLLLTATRLEGKPVSIWAAVGFGVAAGIGLALKPYFLAVPALVELVAIRHQRRLGIVWRPETVAIAATGTLYAASLLLATPAYLFEVMPLVRKIYWGFNSDFLSVCLGAAPEIIGLVFAACLCAKRGNTALQSVLLAASLGFLASYMLQQKGYSYHLFPLRATVTLSLVLHLVRSLDHAVANSRRRYEFVPILAACVVVFGLSLNSVIGWYSAANRSSGFLAGSIDDVVDVIDRYARNQTFYAISTHPFPGFPTALYAHAAWAGRTNSQFLLPAIIKMRAQGVPESDPRLSSVEQTARAMFRQDLEVRVPAVVLVDARTRRHAINDLPFDFLEFYLGDPEIRRIWREYAEMPSIAGFRVFVRQVS
jgi:hypothetical protein